MTKGLKITLITFTGICFVGGIILAVKALSAKPTLTAGGNKTSKDAANSTPTPSSLFPLKLGSRNSKVAELQAALGGLTVDGIFGSKTQAALLAKHGKLTISNQDELNLIKEI